MTGWCVMTYSDVFRPMPNLFSQMIIISLRIIPQASCSQLSHRRSFFFEVFEIKRLWNTAFELGLESCLESHLWHLQYKNVANTSTAVYRPSSARITSANNIKDANLWFISWCPSSVTNVLKPILVLEFYHSEMEVCLSSHYQFFCRAERKPRL